MTAKVYKTSGPCFLFCFGFFFFFGKSKQDNKMDSLSIRRSFRRPFKWEWMTSHHTLNPTPVSLNTKALAGRGGEGGRRVKVRRKLSELKMPVFPFQHKLKWYHAKFVVISPPGSTTESSHVKAARYGTLTWHCPQHPCLPQASGCFMMHVVTPF